MFRLAVQSFRTMFGVTTQLYTIFNLMQHIIFDGRNSSTHNKNNIHPSITIILSTFSSEYNFCVPSFISNKVIFSLSLTHIMCSFSSLPFKLQAIYDMLGACSSNRPADSAEERAKNIFAKMDENNDGQLTQDEFLKGCLQDEELSKMLAP